MKSLSKILPAFPRTPHVPHQPNVSDDDIIASSEDVDAIWNGSCVIEEKIDGASVGMGLFEGEPLIRNRDHILRKGYVKETAAKKQFASIWTWFYKNKDRFEALEKFGPLVIYGEWMVAAHGIHYTQLPDWFVAYDIYDYETGKFWTPDRARSALTALGFTVPSCLFQGEFRGTYFDLEVLSQWPAAWSLEPSEGLYIKVYNHETITGRFKMVKPYFRRGFYWNPKKITKNELSQAS